MSSFINDRTAELIKENNALPNIVDRLRLDPVGGQFDRRRLLANIRKLIPSQWKEVIAQVVSSDHGPIFLVEVERFYKTPFPHLLKGHLYFTTPLAEHTTKLIGAKYYVEQSEDEWEWYMDTALRRLEIKPMTTIPTPSKVRIDNKLPEQLKSVPDLARRLEEEDNE